MSIQQHSKSLSSTTLLSVTAYPCVPLAAFMSPRPTDYL